MKKLKLFAITAAALGLFVVLSGFGTAEETIDVPSELGVMVEHNGTYTEFTFDLTVEELTGYFRTGLVEQMLDGERLHLTSPEDLADILDLIDAAEGTTFDDMWILYGEVIPGTWGCIKCCGGGLSCCCKVKEPDE